jgi:hypothetical protein
MLAAAGQLPTSRATFDNFDNYLFETRADFFSLLL